MVFLVGMEEGVFPHSRSLWEAAELEEERRLAYVGMTRAQRKLYLSCARQRMLYGKTGSGVISRFVQEIPEEFRQDLPVRRPAVLAAAHARLTAAGAERPGRETLSPAPVAAAAVGEAEPVYTAGERVQHEKFGTGTVVTVQPAGQEQIITVAFPDIGVKKLMTGVAPLRRVGSGESR